LCLCRLRLGDRLARLRVGKCILRFRKGGRARFHPCSFLAHRELRLERLERRLVLRTHRLHLHLQACLGFCAQLVVPRGDALINLVEPVVGDRLVAGGAALAAWMDVQLCRLNRRRKNGHLASSVTLELPSPGIMFSFCSACNGFGLSVVESPSLGHTCIQIFKPVRNLPKTKWFPL